MVFYSNDLHLVEVDHRDHTFDGASIPVVGRARAKPTAGKGQTNPLFLFDAEVAGRPWINHYQIGVLDPSLLESSPKLGAFLYS
jgi:hypothetical protein